ncbi:MAG: hypothetical protein HOV77_18015 [Hamadaea sp.]|uniref:hypothetical protein n=1 Tax=Hamadaea sp. TaxID=2024425 RepID=UPI0017B3FB23|nr:hypothetical protein [Hamadaea sp.]NUT21080.1 hypothetical protein [Hamadaea sp.]
MTARSLGVVMLFAAALLCTACTDAESTAPARQAHSDLVVGTQPPIAAVPHLDSIANLTLPIDVYRFSAAQTKMIGSASVLLVNECVRRFGFPPLLTDTYGPGASSLTRRYGVTESEIAEQYGYHVAPQENISTPKDSTGQRFTRAEMLVLSGSDSGIAAAPGDPAPSGAVHSGMPIPPGGCYAEARKKISADDPADTNLASEIARAGFDQAQADTRVTAVFAQWSACMRERGYTAADPLAIAATADLSLPTPRSAEIQTAVADVACKREHNVVGVWFTVESAYQNALIQRHLEKLTVTRRQLDAEVRNAAAVLGLPVPR